MGKSNDLDLGYGSGMSNPDHISEIVTTNTFVSGSGTGESILADIGAWEHPGQAAVGAVGGLDFGSDGPTSCRSAIYLTYRQRCAVRQSVPLIANPLIADLESTSGLPRFMMVSV